jgi:hypothetical protein
MRLHSAGRKTNIFNEEDRRREEEFFEKARFATSHFLLISGLFLGRFSWNYFLKKQEALAAYPQM